MERTQFNETSLASGQSEGIFYNVRVFLWLLIAIMSLSTIFICQYFYQQDKQNVLYSIEANSPDKLQTISNDLSLRIFNVIQSVKYLTSMQAYYLNRDQDAANAKDFQIMLLNMARLAPQYKQIRFLDAQGVEKLRVDQTVDGPKVIDDALLQDKSSRYYVQEALFLDKDGLYISPIDLNIEHGLIERPYVPMMRFIAPVFDKAGVKLGLVVINYDANILLNSLSQYQNKSAVLMLLNEQGYWLKSDDKDKEWGFMFPEKQDVTFAKQFPKIWQKMAHQDQGELSAEQGMFKFITVDFDVYNSKYIPLAGQINLSEVVAKHNRWKVVSYLSTETIDEALFSLKVRYSVIGFLVLALLILLLVVGYRLLVVQSQRHGELLHNAYFDDLTGAYNRAALVELAEQRMQAHHQFSLIYIDLDDFKPINDNYGHHAGDMVLKVVVKRIKKLLRPKDALFRLGGDEFVVLLDGQFNENSLQTITSRIVQKVESPMKVDKNRVRVRVSSGIASSERFSSLDDLLKSADGMMYQAKQHKKTASVEGFWLAE
ncbi:GGDEF domain-containing protein [Thiomicrorhabdus immobilis]|uniref:GGDEF domain-containing protein n=1 Tax=Thiomicrorhabdus immobilis TaxID=2791037 RepID=A0ABM7MFW2_9GAMM|nr:diguanylate cyclase [Thiomicrorhabdus immobilis]BCN94422.1 GGDEF domain-containing protein [Thiomicrorhabdus immobilis]